MIVAADAATFGVRHPGVTNLVGGWLGALSHDGEELRIEDARGNLVNSVAFAPEGDWAVRRIGPLDRLDRQGWEWFAEHNGLGKSLELINRDLPNEFGQNWGSSGVIGGTPGRANSIARTNVAPLVVEVAHAPLVPRSTAPVTVTARLVDERPRRPDGESELARRRRRSVHHRIDVRRWGSRGRGGGRRLVWRDSAATRERNDHRVLPHGPGCRRPYAELSERAALRGGAHGESRLPGGQFGLCRRPIPVPLDRDAGGVRLPLDRDLG